MGLFGVASTGQPLFIASCAAAFVAHERISDCASNQIVAKTILTASAAACEQREELFSPTTSGIAPQHLLHFELRKRRPTRPPEQSLRLNHQQVTNSRLGSTLHLEYPRSSTRGGRKVLILAKSFLSYAQAPTPAASSRSMAGERRCR
jgi:hypothetical protein